MLYLRLMRKCMNYSMYIYDPSLFALKFVFLELPGGTRLPAKWRFYVQPNYRFLWWRA